MVFYSIINEYDVLYAQEREMKYSCENLNKLIGPYNTDLQKSLDLTKIQNILNQQSNYINFNNVL